MTTNQQSSFRQRVEEASVGIVVAVVGTVVGGVLLVVAVLVLGIPPKVGGAGESDSEPKVKTPPPALQARDNAVPDAKGPDFERVWALEGARTFKNPYDVSGEGQRVPYNTPITVACKIYWPELRSVKHDGYWYRILTPPWKGYYSPTNSFWNGDVPGKPATHSVDWAVKTCGAAP